MAANNNSTDITNNELRKLRDKMRRCPNEAEAKFMKRLESAGIEFKFKALVGFYILDFLIPSKMLIIEIDNASEGNLPDYDPDKSQLLRKCGFYILRIDGAAISEFYMERIFWIPTRTEKDFASALAKGNANKGRIMNYDRKVEAMAARGQGGLF